MCSLAINKSFCPINSIWIFFMIKTFGIIFPMNSIRRRIWMLNKSKNFDLRQEIFEICLWIRANASDFFGSCWDEPIRSSVLSLTLCVDDQLIVSNFEYLRQVLTYVSKILYISKTILHYRKKKTTSNQQSVESHISK